MRSLATFAMLVLTRGVNEGLVINDNIRVTIVRVTGGVVRIGIDAPLDAVVLRGEHLTGPTVIDIPVREREEPQA